jgi:hypothetical protein
MIKRLAIAFVAAVSVLAVMSFFALGLYATSLRADNLMSRVNDISAAIAPQSTPVAPTPTAIPVPSNYKIQDTYGYLVAPVIVPDSTSEEQDSEVMQEFQRLVEKTGRSYLTLKCVDLGYDFYICNGYMSK